MSIHIKETSISTDLLDATWTRQGWEVELICEIQGTVWSATLPQMSSEDALTVLKIIEDKHNEAQLNQYASEGF